MAALSIGTLVDVIASKRAQGKFEDMDADCRRFCEELKDATGNDDNTLDDYTHAFFCRGWGGRSQCRNVVLQLMFGGGKKDEWVVLCGPAGIGVLDHNDRFEHYNASLVTKINANANDGAMVRVYMAGERYLELRFGRTFAGQYPTKLLKEVVLDGR